MKKVNINSGFAKISDHWNPRIAAELNDQQVRLVKIKGHDFQFHRHMDEDELFFVVKGGITLEFENSKIDLEENEFVVVPKGTLHRPVAREEAHLMMFVKKSNVNTGNVVNEMTLDTSKLERI